jgi:hypothetical protein
MNDNQQPAGSCTYCQRVRVANKDFLKQHGKSMFWVSYCPECSAKVLSYLPIVIK